MNMQHDVKLPNGEGAINVDFTLNHHSQTLKRILSHG